MDKIRNEIDLIDKQIMDLLNKRFQLTNIIGLYKNENNLPILNQEREEEILRKADIYPNSNAIQDIYRFIFKESRFYQTQYGLIGKKIPYSLSPLIYQEFGLNTYQIIETDDFNKTMSQGHFKGVNVTIPYKSEAYKYCQELDESAIKTKVVNTIVNNKGYNTDYLALKAIFNKYHLDFTNSKVVIIGNGATSRSVKEAINVDPIFLVRTKRSDNEYLISDYEKFSDCDYLFNTTPYGTYPDLKNNPLFPLDKFKNLKLVFDVVYNPLNSPLILEAKRHNLNTMNGLELLITQAYYSYQLFFHEDVNLNEVIQKMTKNLYNLVLIGPSYSGKSTLARKLRTIFNKKLVDIDENLKAENHDLETILKTQPESIFREYEKQEVLKYANSFNNIIATGGGVVLSEEAMAALKRNSIIIFLNPSLDTLIKRIDNTRPLIKNANDLISLYQKRLPLYQKYHDLEIQDESQIVERINEYFNNQWS
ncbi:MAG TPA: shikimate kinase [Bacilli bacterium]